MNNKTIWKKALEQGLDEKDVRLLYALGQERKFSDEDIKAVAKSAGIPVAEAKTRITNLRDKRILLKDQASVIDPLMVWDGYYIVLIKAAIKPPVVGMETKFPTGWEFDDYLASLRKVEKKLGLKLIRQAYVLQGTEWDIFLIVSATSQNEFAEFMTEAAAQGWITKTWSFTPVEYGAKWVFDPIASPDPGNFKTEAAAHALWKKK